LKKAEWDTEGESPGEETGKSTLVWEGGANLSHVKIPQRRTLGRKKERQSTTANSRTRSHKRRYREKKILLKKNDCNLDGLDGWGVAPRRCFSENYFTVKNTYKKIWSTAIQKVRNLQEKEKTDGKTLILLMGKL